MNIWGGMRSTPCRGNNQYNSLREESTWNDLGRGEGLYGRSVPRILFCMLKWRTLWVRKFHEPFNVKSAILCMLMPPDSPYSWSFLSTSRMKCLWCDEADSPSLVPIFLLLCLSTQQSPTLIGFHSSVPWTLSVESLPQPLFSYPLLSEWHGIPFNSQTWDQFPAKG